jgi:hypothetical protein
MYFNILLHTMMAISNNLGFFVQYYTTIISSKIKSYWVSPIVIIHIGTLGWGLGYPICMRKGFQQTCPTKPGKIMGYLILSKVENCRKTATVLDITYIGLKASIPYLSMPPSMEFSLCC